MVNGSDFLQKNLLNIVHFKYGRGDLWYVVDFIYTFFIKVLSCKIPQLISKMYLKKELMKILELIKEIKI